MILRGLPSTIIRPQRGDNESGTARPVSALTLAELLHQRAQAHPDRLVYTFVETGGRRRTMTYGQLDAAARALANRLSHAAEPGDRALLVYPAGLDFIVALLSCFYSGVTAVPVYPPHPKRSEPAMPRLTSIVGDARPRVILTTAELHGVLNSALPGPTTLATDELQLSPPSDGHSLRLRHSSLAMLQYTSGSTGTPRGVMLSHGNLLANLRLIQQAFGTSSNSSGVFWLPFYHDMGLIGGVLETLFCGGRSLFFAPQAFVQSPIRWLEAISSERATISGAPNFAYDECLKRITPEQCQRLDLSRWRLAFCGAEPVRPSTMKRFAEKFAGCGFREGALHPCYGLAEATLIVSAAGFKPCEEHSPRAAGSHEVISCGPPLGGQRVAIVDPESRTELADGEIGEVWVAGPCVAGGYWNRPEETRESFDAHLANGQGPFLRTGDLGLLRAGQLHITGRIKDLIIVGGKNHAPQDIEQTAESCHASILPGGCAAFGVELDGAERVVVVAEVDRHAQRESRQAAEGDDAAGLRQAIQTIRRNVAQRHALEVYQVVLVKPRTLPRTTSGKLRRHACREAFLAGQLDAVVIR